MFKVASCFERGEVGGQCSFFLDIPLEAGCSIHSDEWGEGGGWAEAERATEEDKKNGFKVELLA